MRVHIYQETLFYTWITKHPSGPGNLSK